MHDVVCQPARTDQDQAVPLTGSVTPRQPWADTIAASSPRLPGHANAQQVSSNPNCGTKPCVGRAQQQQLYQRQCAWQTPLLTVAAPVQNPLPGWQPLAVRMSGCAQHDRAGKRPANAECGRPRLVYVWAQLRAGSHPPRKRKCPVAAPRLCPNIWQASAASSLQAGSLNDIV